MTEFKSTINIEEKVKELEATKDMVIALIPEEHKAEANEKMEVMANIIATIATNMAIKSATDAFVEKVKEAAEAGKAAQEAADE